MGDNETGLERLAATVGRLRREIREARAGADARALIELATGVLVERLRCGPAQAARQLEQVAARMGLTPLELAAQLVDAVPRDSPGPVADSPAPAETSDAVRMGLAESAALAASDASQVAASLLEHALAPIGAAAVVVWSAGGDSSLTLAGSAGITGEEAARWRYVPPGVAIPAQQALARREAVWIEDLSTSGMSSAGHRDLAGRAAIPALLGGRVVGVLEVCWPGPLTAKPKLEPFADLVAHTLDAATGPEPAATADLVAVTDALLNPALVLRHDPHAGDFRIRHVNRVFADLAGVSPDGLTGAGLLEVYPLLAGADRLYDAIERVHATGEPFLAHRMTLPSLSADALVVADVSVSRHGEDLLLVLRAEDDAARLAGLLQEAQRLARVGGFEENVTTGDITWSGTTFGLCGLKPGDEPIPLARLPEHADTGDVPAIDGFLRTVLDRRLPASVTFRMPRPDGVTRHLRLVAEPVRDSTGEVLRTVRGAYQDISAQHWTEVALSATRDQLSQTEERAEERNRLALDLQTAILPAAGPVIDTTGLRIAARYRPAEQEHLVGGDWYDAVTLPSKQILLSVGDIAGHGIQAATGMVVLRNALRGLAATGAAPAQLLSWLNLVAYHLTDRICGTVVCALYDPATRLLRWARAGHPPPLLVRDGGARSLPMLTGVLLGAFERTDYQEGEVELGPGDRLLLYTDGLVERKDRPLDDCIQDLLTVAAGSAAPLEDWVDHVLGHSAATTVDDTCVVAVDVT
ncbi:MAG TPA: SpoIIE family protein phosphatase [Amycolatopsis sp.]|nr:SpoIIE family protein phosphatase [Amycolatopsis sp.]